MDVLVCLKGVVLAGSTFVLTPDSRDTDRRIQARKEPLDHGTPTSWVPKLEKVSLSVAPSKTAGARVLGNDLEAVPSSVDVQVVVIGEAGHQLRALKVSNLNSSHRTFWCQI